jgi:uncharacterized membrane protein YfhO
MATHSSLSPLTFLTFLSPELFSSLSGGEYWGHGYRTESYLYSGVVPAMLLLRYGILEMRLGESCLRFFGVVGLLAALYAVGSYTPVYRLAYDVVPGVDFYRRPPDAMFLVNIVLALSSGYILDSLASEPNPRRISRGASVILSLFTIVCVSWLLSYAHSNNKVQHVVSHLFVALLLAFSALWLLRRMARYTGSRRSVFVAFILALVILDLYTFNVGNRLNARSAEVFAVLDARPEKKNPTLAFLEKELANKQSPKGPFRADLTAVRGYWQNVSAIYRIQSTQGYSPLKYFMYSRAVGVQTANAEDMRPFTPLTRGYDSPMIDLLGVRYIVTTKELSEIDPHIDVSRFPVVYREGDIAVYENPDVLPRVLTPSKVRVVSSFDEAIARGDLADVDFTETVLLEAVPGTSPDSLDFQTGSLPGSGDVDARILSYRNTEVRISVKAEKATIVVLNDLYYPYWRVFVDGEEEPLLRANYIFRAVHVTAGTHDVVFRFSPLSLDALRKMVEFHFH